MVGYPVEKGTELLYRIPHANFDIGTWLLAGMGERSTAITR